MKSSEEEQNHEVLRTSWEQNVHQSGNVCFNTFEIAKTLKAKVTALKCFQR